MFPGPRGQADAASRRDVELLISRIGTGKLFQASYVDSPIVVGHRWMFLGKGSVDFRGACGIGRLIRWVVIEDIMSNEAGTVGIEK